jgi:hypothetical protein
LTLSRGQDPLQIWDGFKGACGERRVAEIADIALYADNGRSFSFSKSGVPPKADMRRYGSRPAPIN